MPKSHSRKTAQVFDISNFRDSSKQQGKKIVRVSPETDGLAMLYGNDANPGKLFSMKIIGWGLQTDGQVTGLVPWLNTLMPCPELQDPLNGHWEGYFNSETGQVFYKAPIHKKVELEAANDYYRSGKKSPAQTIIQEIPDTIGTHAVLTEGPGKLKITEVFSWRLLANGQIQGMLIDIDKIQRTPVLLGDPSLYAAQSSPNFKYFFQYRIANRIKREDPEALKAIALLIGR